MLSQTSIQDIHLYDVICIGNFAAIAADRLSQRYPDKYKIALLNFRKKINVPANSGIGSSAIAVSSIPKGVDVYQGKVQQLIPKQKRVIIDNGKILVYKFLLYGQDSWKARIHRHPLAQALSCQYSRVYSNLSQCQQLLTNSGNIVFYVHSGPGSFRQNYPFLKLAHKINWKQQFRIIIILQGNSFFPHCQQAHQLLEEQLHHYQIDIVYNVKTIKVDYLRRVFYYHQGELDHQISYESVYCFIGQQVPKLLTEASIDPYNCSDTLLNNNDYDSIYVIGADVFPTTMSLHSLSMQIHHTVHNVLQRLIAKQNKVNSSLSVYDGATSFKLYLGGKQIGNIKHFYKGNGFQFQVVGCLGSMMHDCLSGYTTKKYLNFQNFGPPHYLWPPNLLNAEEQIEEIQLSQQQQLLTSQFNRSKKRI